MCVKISYKAKMFTQEKKANLQQKEEDKKTRKGLLC